MSDDGSSKDDIKMPENEVGDKITKMFREDEKDTSKRTAEGIPGTDGLIFPQMSSFSVLWVRRLLWTARRLPNLEPFPISLKKSTIRVPYDTRCGSRRGVSGGIRHASA